jgi:hypothetical protein
LIWASLIVDISMRSYVHCTHWLMESALSRIALAFIAVLLPMSAQASTIKLAPHRAVYDLLLTGSSGPKGIEAASGRMAFDFTGDACTGYALTFRQVTVLSTAESGTRTSDLRTTTFEDGAGKSLRFKSQSRFDNAPTKDIDGSASIDAKGRFNVKVNRPVPDKADTDETGILFPSAHLVKIIEAARAGETTFTVRVFDGSDDGKKIYDTLSVIGKLIPAGKVDGLEAAAQHPDLTKLNRWPVSVSYYGPGEGERTPIYVIAFDLYENGISRALKIDYGDFSLAGEMKQLDMLKPTDCAK